MLYPGLIIDFSTRIESHCTIVCVKGGRLKIARSKVSFGSCIIADTGSDISIESSFIGRNCVITSKKSIRILNGSLIAEMVVIRDQDHDLDRREKDLPDTEVFASEAVEIGPNAWIASKATVLKGVHIGKNSVVAASAVVTQNIPSGELWAGIPARFLKRTYPTP